VSPGPAIPVSPVPREGDGAVPRGRAPCAWLGFHGALGPELRSLLSPRQRLGSEMPLAAGGGHHTPGAGVPRAAATASAASNRPPP